MKRILLAATFLIVASFGASAYDKSVPCPAELKQEDHALLKKLHDSGWPWTTDAGTKSFASCEQLHTALPILDRIGELRARQLRYPSCNMNSNVLEIAEGVIKENLQFQKEKCAP
jgi:hypothetical protein